MAECYIKIFKIFSISALLESSELKFLESSTDVESTFSNCYNHLFMIYLIFVGFS